MPTGTEYLTKIEQNELEFEAWLAILRQQRVKSYLEIGCKWGGTLWRAAHVLPKGSMLVAVDLPHGSKETQESLLNCCAHLIREGYQVRHLLADSTSRMTVGWVKQYAPFDAVFIDANHTLPYVTKDWNNYGPLGKLVAFHDIGWMDKPGREGRLPIEVPKLWAKLKQGNGQFHSTTMRFQEIKLCPADNGIGIVWRAGI